MSKSSKGTIDNSKNVEFEVSMSEGSGGGGSFHSDVSETGTQPLPPRKRGGGMGMMVHSPPITRAASNRSGFSSNSSSSDGGDFSVQSGSVGLFLKNFGLPTNQNSSSSSTASSSSSSSSPSSSASSSSFLLPTKGKEKEKEKEGHHRSLSEGGEREDDDDELLLQPFNPHEGLEEDQEKGMFNLRGFLEKDLLDRNSLAFRTMTGAFGPMEQFDPVYHQLEGPHLAAILQRLKGLPLTWTRGKVAKTTFNNRVENVAYRAQLGLRSIQDAALGVFHGIQTGDVELVLQLALDIYALATNSSTDCKTARIDADMQSLSHAIQQTNRPALITPGVERRLEEAGMSDSNTNQFFPAAGRGYSPTFFPRSRGRGYGRGGAWGRGYGYQRGSFQRGGYRPQQQWGNQQGFQQGYQQRFQQLPFTSQWRGANRGRAFTPPPGRGYRGRGRY
jgi:hypothetical protein